MSNTSLSFEQNQSLDPRYCQNYHNYQVHQVVYPMYENTSSISSRQKVEQLPEQTSNKQSSKKMKSEDISSSTSQEFLSMMKTPMESVSSSNGQS